MYIAVEIERSLMYIVSVQASFSVLKIQKNVTKMTQTCQNKLPQNVTKKISK